jgi:hypothetical protein
MLVSLEIFFGGEWREIALLRTNRRGAFAYRYTFAAIGPATYRFRAQLPHTIGQSPFHVFPGTITLADVVRCEGTLYYSRARYHFKYGGPYGEPSSGTANIEPFGEEGEPICGSTLG